MIQFNANATAVAVEAVVENLTYFNRTRRRRSRKVSVVVSDGDGGQSLPRTIDINVTSQSDGAVAAPGDQQVNTYVVNEQTLPMIGALQGGNTGQYVIVWQSYFQDSDSWGVLASGMTSTALPSAPSSRSTPPPWRPGPGST